MPKIYLSSPTLFTFSRKNKYNGFTLVEVLVVIAIITVLAALVITTLNPAQLRRAARDTNRKKDIALISAALEQYYADNNVYPAVTGANAVAQFNCLETILEGADNNCTTPANAAAPDYIRVLPETQSATVTEYCYSRPDTQNFIICAPQEADRTNVIVGGTGTPCTTTAPAGTTTFGNYCIENPF